MERERQRLNTKVGIRFSNISGSHSFFESILFLLFLNIECNTSNTMTDQKILSDFKKSLRSSAWLAHPRAALTVRMWALAAVPVLMLAFSVYLDVGLTNGIGKVIGEDFINYWMGAKFALSGQASDVYDLKVFLQALESFAGTKLEPYNYSYPPNWLLLSVPLAFLPFIPALIFWTVAGWLAVFFMIKSLLGSWRSALWAVAASPAVFVNALYGQNGALSAVFLGGGLLVLESSPILAGVLLGALSFKPQLGLLIPVALIAGGHWRAFGAAAVTVVALIVVSSAWFGGHIWFDFVERMSLINQVVLAQDDVNWHRMPTPYLALRVVGVDSHFAGLFQVIVTMVAALAVFISWRSSARASVKATALVLATFLATPYFLDYDFVVVLVVFAWRLKDGEWRPWEGLALVLVLLLPFMVPPAIKLLSLPIGPLVLGWALWCTTRTPLNKKS